VKHTGERTCPKCGYVPGATNRDLTEGERRSLLALGCVVDKNVHGDDIATMTSRDFSGALFVFHRMVCSPDP
jgi:hypothetical protein